MLVSQRDEVAVGLYCTLDYLKMQLGCEDPCLQELGLGHYDVRVCAQRSRHMLDPPPMQISRAR